MKRKTWKEFQDSKLLWWVNRSLHLFGWAIVFQHKEDGTVSDVYPARVTFRGFTEDVEEDGFAGLTRHLAGTVGELVVEANANSATSGLIPLTPGQPAPDADPVRSAPVTRIETDVCPHSRKATGLPCPRIEFEHIPSEAGWGDRRCVYWLVIGLGELDIRAEDDEGRTGVFRERYIPMGVTEIMGGEKRPGWDGGKIDTPFRDGAHARWDRLALGLPNLPIYARCENDVTLVEWEQAFTLDE